jgi:uncharacterized protein YbjT (DUF2867 family)
MTSERLVLVTGATGYVGGNLAPRLLAMGYRVRMLARDASRLQGRSWRSQVEVVEGDILSPQVVNQALQEVSTAYYLIHNMASGKDYVEKEIESAHNFATAASAAGVEHIIYLGGLADPAEDIGSHLRSRLQTGAILRQGSVPVTEFRSSLIIGSGSYSFELIRYLSEQFPILPGPRWMHKCTQPIAIQNVLDYLTSALENQACRGKTYEIGGKDMLRYADTIYLYARLRGLKRRLIPLPGIPIKVLAELAGILTPVPARIASPLLEGMRGASVICNDSAKRDFPLIQPIGYEAAVSRALEHLSPGCLESRWKKDASSFRIKQEGFFIEGQQVRLQVRPEEAYRAIVGLGGKRGWLYLNGLWKLRGLIDRLVGGPGLRGRRTAGNLIEGDVLDIYRVEALEPNRLMRLRAEMKAPGVGWMEWRIQPNPDGALSLTQIAYFAPKGAFGFLYWYLLLPVHRLVFTGLLKALARLAVESQNPG